MHYRLIPDAELPTVTEDDGTQRDATAQELLNHGLLRIGTDPDTGDGIYSVACTAPCPGHPGTEIASGFLQERHDAIPEDLRPHVFRAAVYRATDGTNLRETLQTALGKRLEAGVPAGGKRSEEPEFPDEARAILEEARRRAADEDEPVERRQVPMAEVEAGDVVDEDLIYPMRWAGEISTR